MTTNTNLQPQALNENASIAYVDPATLLVDRNVRSDARLGREFLASVRDLGVLVPIVAVRTSDGSLRVRYGHRRTLAAVEAGHAYVPVVVVADESVDDVAEVARLVGQYAENEHRSGLTNTERVDVFTQLQAFGVSAAQIAKRTKTRRKDVDAALTVAGSHLARAAATRYDFLTLDQAAVVAEFEDNAEAVKALVVAAREGGFDHVAQSLRDDAAARATHAAVCAALEQSGVTVIDPPGWRDVATGVHHLLDDSGDSLTSESHRSCPGHAAYVDPWADEGTDAAVYVCTDPAMHGHRLQWSSEAPERPEPTDEERAEKTAERRLVVANNKAWRSAEVVRREWLASFCGRKTAPKGAARFVAESLARGDYCLRKALDDRHRLAKDLFGGSVLTGLDEATDSRAQLAGLGLVLAAYEADTGTHSWRQVQEPTARYLAYLQSLGYELAEVEQVACGLAVVENTDADR